MTALFTSMSLNDYLIYLDVPYLPRCPLMTTLFTSMSLNDYLIYLDVSLYTSMSLNDYLDVP